MSNILHISYGIDEKNKIIFVNDAWSEFAIANNAPELVADKVLNRNLWDFISDDVTREIYIKLIDKARAGQSFTFNFHCDSPGISRFFEMKITPQKDKIIRFDTRIINIEERSYQNVFQNDARRASSLIVVCSWCKKINARDGTWHEIEDALFNLEIFESENTPQMSHGMCVSCFQSISEKHRETFESKTADE